MPETFALPLNIFDNDSSFWHCHYLCTWRRSYQKRKYLQVGNFRITVFDLNQSIKTCLKKTFQFRTFAQGAYTIFTLKVSETLSWYRRKKYRSLKETGTSCKNKFKEKNFKTMWRHKRKLESARKLWYLFLRTFWPVVVIFFFLEERLGTRLCFP